jgi:arylsulfatase A-like enzyme/Tfp pilus assembly protein PilF
MKKCVCLVLLAMWVSIQAKPAQIPAQPANLLVITLDTVRADHLECYGYKNIRTPRINALAADGTLVEHAYTPIPLTLPSHASIFTGTYPVFHGVRDFTGFTLGKERTTLASMLKSAGYRTGAVVASAVLEARWGINQGFDFYYDNFPPALPENWQVVAERRGDEVVRESNRWLDRQKAGAPFFLWVHLFDPHDPYKPPPPYDRQYSVRPYDGEIAYTDENVGHVIDHLKQRGLYENTLVVLLGDHGEGLGDHGESTHGFFIYDSTLRVPMIFKLPGASSPRGKRIPGPLRTIDVVPTVLQVLGLSGKVRAAEVQGRGAYGAFLGRGSLSGILAQAEIMLPFYHFEWSPLSSIRMGRYKYIEAPRPELYDTNADPGEKRDLSGENRAVASQLKTLLGQDITRYSSGSPAAVIPKDADPAMVEKLASLGYLALSRGAAAPGPGKNLPDPKDRISLYELINSGTLAAREKDYARAANLLNEALKRDPLSLVAHFQLGVVYRVTGALEQAEYEFMRTLQLRPGYDLALRRLAEVYMAGRRYQDAESVYKKLLSQAPNDYLAHFSLGGLYVTLDRWNEALASFRQAHALNPSDTLVSIVISRILLKSGDLDGALDSVQQALKIDPELASGHETAMEIYRRQGRSAEAFREEQILQRLKSRK